MYMVSIKNKNFKRESQVGTAGSHEDAIKLIGQELKRRNIVPHIYRTYSIDGGLTETVDYGSHTEFFQITENQEKE